MDEDFEDQEDFDSRISHYIDLGVVEVGGVSEDGELVYSINENAEFLAPELWKSHMEYVDRMLIDMYKMGLMKVEYDENLEATISLSDEGLKFAKENGILPVDISEIPND